jgi:ferredoxin
MKIKVRINKDTCISCGSCFATVPDVYLLAGDGKAEVQPTYFEMEITDQALIDRILMTRDACPSVSIEVEELPE